VRVCTVLIISVIVFVIVFVIAVVVVVVVKGERVTLWMISDLKERFDQ
jgi:cytochrome b